MAQDKNYTHIVINTNRVQMQICTPFNVPTLSRVSFWFSPPVEERRYKSFPIPGCFFFWWYFLNCFNHVRWFTGLYSLLTSHCTHNPSAGAILILPVQKEKSSIHQRERIWIIVGDEVKNKSVVTLAMYFQTRESESDLKKIYFKDGMRSPIILSPAELCEHDLLTPCVCVWRLSVSLI